MRSLKYRLGESEDLAKLVIRGFEDEGDNSGTGGSGDAGESGSGDDSGGDDAGGDDTGGGDDAGDDGGDDLPDDAEALKAALRSERQLRKKAEKGQKLTGRELAKLRKAQDDIKAAEEGEVAAAKKKADEAAAKSSKLAAKLRQTSLEKAITEAARKANFRDPDDVITQLHRSNFAGIEIDQDDEDPSDVEVDKASVEKAVKKIATEKPHWLIAAGDDKPSGSSFNGGTPNNKGGNKAQEYADRFPALRNRITPSSK